MELITQVLFQATTGGFQYYNPWHCNQGSSHGLSSKVTFEELKGCYEFKASQSLEIAKKARRSRINILLTGQWTVYMSVNII